MGQSKEVITRDEFEKLSKEWTDINAKYDKLFQDFLDNPHTKTQEEINYFKVMQGRVYALELELYGIAEGKMIIVEN